MYNDLMESGTEQPSIATMIKKGCCEVVANDGVFITIKSSFDQFISTSPETNFVWYKGDVMEVDMLLEQSDLSFVPLTHK